MPFHPRLADICGMKNHVGRTYSPGVDLKKILLERFLVITLVLKCLDIWCSTHVCMFLCFIRLHYFHHACIENDVSCVFNTYFLYHPLFYLFRQFEYYAVLAYICREWDMLLQEWGIYSLKKEWGIYAKALPSSTSSEGGITQLHRCILCPTGSKI